MLEFDELQDLETPCFVFDEPELKANFNDFRTALHEHWGPNANVGYSVKTNPFPWIVRTALDCGCMAEVVSDDEYALALEQRHRDLGGQSGQQDPVCRKLRMQSALSLLPEL